ncbi:MAG: CapA family protein, partial [Woeseiales bacterium]
MSDYIRQGCLIVTLLLAGCVAPIPQPAPEPAPTPPSTQPDPAITQPEPVATGPDRALQRLSIAAVGDMMLGTDYPRNHLPDDDGVSFLQTVTPVLAAADIAFGNLEGVLLDGGEPAKQCSNPSA